MPSPSHTSWTDHYGTVSGHRVMEICDRLLSDFRTLSECRELETPVQAPCSY
jgi:hypothetical protein